MKHYILLSILFVFYLVRFEGYTWSPCTFDKNSTYGTCFAINCPAGGCVNPAEMVVCEDTECVKNTLNKRGIEHLEGVYKVTVSDYSMQTTVSKMQISQKYTVD